jgi:mannose-6-phosphate isomerase
VIRLTPSFREKIWGSRRLEPWFPNSDLKIGEVWFEDAEDSPLLIKFIFTSEKLSVQVHPDDEYARAHHQSRGKTEMWHILAAEPGAKIAAGFRQPISRERLREASVSGEIEQLLAWHDARPGDTFYIPAGTVHAIGAGLALCEIQQRSDITYRLYDYGRPRELHLERAVEVSRLEPYVALRPREDNVLVNCDYFVTRRIALVGSKMSLEAGFAIVLHGTGAIGGEAVKPGEVWRLDRSAAAEAGEEMILLHVSLP